MNLAIKKLGLETKPLFMGWHIATGKRQPFQGVIHPMLTIQARWDKSRHFLLINQRGTLNDWMSCSSFIWSKWCEINTDLSVQYIFRGLKFLMEDVAEDPERVWWVVCLEETNLVPNIFQNVARRAWVWRHSESRDFMGLVHLKICLCKLGLY